MTYEELKLMVMDLGFVPENEDAKEELFMVTDEENGIKNLVIDREDPILILEQVVGVTGVHPALTYGRLLQMNREMVHGAFALDSESGRVIWRDTLQMANLDKNELEGSIQALALAMAENAEELVEMFYE